MKIKNPEWFKKRGYLHFDDQIDLKSAIKIVTNPKRIASHSFYPMLRYFSFSTKVKKDSKDGSLKKTSKGRPITYASHIDSHIYSYYGKILERAYEQKLLDLGISDCILAFRKLGKSNVDFSYEAFSEIESRSSCNVIALDISGFFDNLCVGFTSVVYSIRRKYCYEYPPKYKINVISSGRDLAMISSRNAYRNVFS